MEKDLSPLVKQNFLNLVLGSMQVTSGVFVLLFSQRMNKEISVVITGNHERSEILKRLDKILEQEA